MEDLSKLPVTFTMK